MHEFICFPTDATGGLSGGWVPTTHDTSQWLQVDMDEAYIFRQLLTQGRSDDAAWVTSFYILYADNDTLAFTTFVNDSGDSVSVLVAYKPCYRKVSNIRRTKSQNLNASRLLL